MLRLAHFAAAMVVACLTVSTLCGNCMAREAGWVPLENNNVKKSRPPAAPTRVPVARKFSTASEAPVVAGASVYEGQAQITEGELNSFLDILPAFRQWAKKNAQKAGPVVNVKGKPDFLYSRQAADWVESHSSFSPRRFFCLMGKLAAALAIVEKGNDYNGQRPADMPAVTDGELALARRHLGELLTASEGAAP